MKLFDVGFDKEIIVIANDFECSICGTSARQALIKGRTTNKYETVKGKKRRLIIEARNYGPISACNCHDQILIANKELYSSPSDLSPLKGVLDLGNMSESSARTWLASFSSYLGTSCTSSNLSPSDLIRLIYEETEEQPFLMTVLLSEKGKKAGLVKREDGIYTKFGTKLIDREILVK